MHDIANVNFNIHIGGGVGGRDRMVVGLKLPVHIQSVHITTKVMSLNPVHGKVNSIQRYVIQFVSDLRQVSGFLWVLYFSPPIKVTAMI